MATDYFSQRCEQYGGPEILQWQRFKQQQPGPGQVLIAVHAAGVNFFDTLILQNRYQTKPELPFTPGGEIAGHVLSVGDGVEGWKLGDRVMASLSYGGFSEQCLVSASDLLPVPESLGLTEAAAFPVVWGSSLYALKQRGNLQVGETLLVLGASGGVGLAAVQLGKQLGARVIAAASGSDKLAIARKYGADEVIDYQQENIRDRCKALTDGAGVNVVFDAVGGESGQLGLKSLAWGGRLLVVGFASGDIPDFPANWTLIKNSSIIGVFWGAWADREPEEARANIALMLDWFASGDLQPMVSKTYPLENAVEALKDIQARKVVGKVVLTTRYY